MSEQVKVLFTAKKATKGTIVYEEQPAEGKQPVIGTLYVKKWFAGTAQALAVTVEKLEVPSK